MASFYNGYNLYLQNNNNNNINQRNNNNNFGTTTNPYEPKKNNVNNNYEKKEEFSYTLRKTNTYNNNDPFKQNSYNIISNNNYVNRAYPNTSANYNAKNFQNNQRKDHVAEIFNNNIYNTNNNKNSAYYNNVYGYGPKTYRTQYNQNSPQQPENNNNNINNNLNSTLNKNNTTNNNLYNNNNTINATNNFSNTYTQRNYSLNNNQYNPLYNSSINNYNNPLYSNNNINQNLYNNNNTNISATEKLSQELPEYTNKNCTAVIEYSYKEDPNSRFRNYMEDKGVVLENINNNPNNILFCLFDGHGGGEVSKYLQKNFPTHFKEFLNNNSYTNNISSLFTSLYPFVDDKIKSSNFNQMGSTACTVYLTKENSKRVLYTANIGDTRCIIISKSGAAKRLTFDHRASDKEEQTRITEAGGIVFAGRVYGQLMLSRAFGDWELKTYGVSNVPFVNKIEIDGVGEWKWMVLASDGIWDVFEDEEIGRLSLSFEGSKEFCNEIIKEGMERGTMDNISCFVVKLN